MASLSSESTSLELLDLYTDALLEIFSYLDLKSLVSVATTCKHLKEATYYFQSRLWNDCQIIIEDGETVLLKEVAEGFGCRRIKEAHIDNPVAQNLQLLAAEARLEILRVNASIWFDAHVSPAQFDSLKCLSLCMTVDQDEFTEEFRLHELMICFPSMINLQQLFILLDSDEPEELANHVHCYQIIEMCLRGLPKLNDLGLCRIMCVSGFTEWTPKDGMVTWPILERLCIHQQHIDSLFLTAGIPKIFPNVRHLELGEVEDQKRIDDRALNRMLSNMLQLESLKLNLTKCVLLLTIPHLPNLKALCVGEYVDQTGMHEVLQNTPKLHVLNVFHDFMSDRKFFTQVALLTDLRILGFNPDTDKDCFAWQHKKPLQDYLVSDKATLVSVIGVEFIEETLKSLPESVKFVLKEEKSGSKKLCVYSRQALGGWKQEKKFSKSSHEAYGSSYFLPKSSHRDYMLEDLMDL